MGLKRIGYESNFRQVQQAAGWLFSTRLCDIVAIDYVSAAAMICSSFPGQLLAPLSRIGIYQNVDRLWE